MSDQNVLPSSLHRGLLLLAYVSEVGHPVSFSEVVRYLNVNKMTTSRLLTGLVGEGYLVKNEEGLYLPGARLESLLGRESVDRWLVRCFRLPMERVVQEVGHSGILLEWNGSDMMCRWRHLCEESIVLIPPGQVVRRPFEYPAGVFCMEASAWETYLKQPETRHLQSWYKRERKRMEHKGFCFGHAEDRQRVAAPVYRKGLLVGSLLIGAPKDALTEEQLEAVGRQLSALSQN